MKVIRANVLGFCMGVRRAVEKADYAIKTYEKKNIYSLGPLIHNPLVLNILKNKGLSIIDERDIENISSNSAVIIRAHGVSKKIKDRLQNRNITIVDATCPRVAVSQTRAADYSKKGITVILAGDKGHGEVESIAGYAGEKFILLESFEDTKLFVQKKAVLPEHAVLLSQTTFSVEEFEKISKFLKEKISKLDIFNTICPATRERQKALEQLCKEVDGVLVIGGKKSANTRRLYEKAAGISRKAVLIEDVNEIPSEFYTLDTVGLTAGASTPDFCIDGIEKKLLEKGLNR